MNERYSRRAYIQLKVLDWRIDCEQKAFVAELWAASEKASPLGAGTGVLIIIVVAAALAWLWPSASGCVAVNGTSDVLLIDVTRLNPQFKFHSRV